jgi:hypothetical protein
MVRKKHKIEPKRPNRDGGAKKSADFFAALARKILPAPFFAYFCPCLFSYISTNQFSIIR